MCPSFLPHPVCTNILFHCVFNVAEPLEPITSFQKIGIRSFKLNYLGLPVLSTLFHYFQQLKFNKLYSWTKAAITVWIIAAINKIRCCIYSILRIIWSLWTIPYLITKSKCLHLTKLSFYIELDLLKLAQRDNNIWLIKFDVITISWALCIKPIYKYIVESIF
jgi:hypothetical protein